MVKDLFSQPQYAPEEIYTLLASQVQSYFSHRHMGVNTSVTAELAQELLESLMYTLRFATGGEIHEALAQGQAILSEKLEQAHKMLRLVSGTAGAGSQWFWQTLRQLESYLENYDYLHLAHRIPVWLDYPLVRSVPEELLGIDWVLAYLNCLWMENQILYAFPAGVWERLQDALPVDAGIAPENLVQPPLQDALKNKLSDLATDADWEEAKIAVCRELGLQGSVADYAMAALNDAQVRLQAMMDAGRP